MSKQIGFGGLSIVLVVAVLANAAEPKAKDWKANDRDRPQPKIVAPGEKPGQAPSDAIVLFDGKDLSKWESVSAKGGAPKWRVQNGAMTVVPLTGSIRTKQAFGDCQLHIEWNTVKGSRSNSGVFFQGLYELQVYDSYQNKMKIYADGVAGGMYGQHPPLVNVCRPTGQWQSFDVVFRAPRFDPDGKLIKPGTMTTFQNGVLVLDNAEIQGFTVHGRKAKYRPHAPKQPLLLQNHSDPVSFRNIWIRPLP